MGGILSDTEILRAIQTGDIDIDPFDPERVNPVSVDLTLGDEVAVYPQWVDTSARPMGQVENGSFFTRNQYGLIRANEEPAEVKRFRMDSKEGWCLKPNIGYLMHVKERIHTKRYVPILDGKSSIGRLFIQVHATAGFGDPNFNGQFTLEVIVQHPVVVYPGMRIAQVRFQTIEGTVARLYDGNYTGEDASGAVASKCWKQFQK